MKQKPSAKAEKRVRKRELLVRFGAALQRAREQAGLRRMDLARRMGVQHVRIVRLEKGINDPRLSTIISLSEALGLKPGDLLNGLAAVWGITGSNGPHHARPPMIQPSFTRPSIFLPDPARPPILQPGPARPPQTGGRFTGHGAPDQSRGQSSDLGTSGQPAVRRPEQDLAPAARPARASGNARSGHRGQRASTGLSKAILQEAPLQETLRADPVRSEPAAARRLPTDLEAG